VKISILASDLSDNATGRADLLARLLSSRYEVDVVGPQFGEGLWAPSRDGAVAYRSVRAGRDPGFARHVPELLALVDGEILVASKPRPTSFGLGLLARARRPRPLVLDIDDWEVGFFYRSGTWGRVGRALNLANPNGLPWTWLAEKLIGRADAITVASRFLERRFGGTFLPHVRDTEAWDPARYDRADARARQGVGASKVVMFLGTPRGHKGVDDLIDAVGLLGPGVILALVGVDPARGGAPRWSRIPHVRVTGEIPFDDVPRYLIAADVVAVPQRDTTDTVAQVPAKLFDAMALARPIVSTSVSMIPEILDGCGLVVEPGDVPALAGAIKRLLDNAEEAAALGRLARQRCEARYSFRVARATLFPLIERLTAQRSACERACR
jgi:glycosyltransferase involved in cell wall biosynthesis